MFEDEEIETEKSPIEVEVETLRLFEAIKNPNDKKVKKLAAKLYNELTDPTALSFCRDIYSSDSPYKYLLACSVKINDTLILIDQFLAEGYHGMILTGSDACTVYPIKLHTNERWLTENKRWDLEQEKELQRDAALNWMIENDKDDFFGKVILFPKFGFSGQARIHDIRNKD